MKFQFHINLTDRDYLNYNIFWMTKSPYGKKQMMKFRIVITVCFALLCLLSLYVGKFSGKAFIGIIPYLILLGLFQLLLKPSFVRSFKASMKSLKKQGKMAYSPKSEIEFFEDSFTETTPENRTEQTYASVERISVIKNEVIYIHVNNVMSYLLPLSCFESEEQYNEFMKFLQSKCRDITVY